MAERIVVGVDGSQGAERALSWAVDEAARRVVELEVVHVAEAGRADGTVLERALGQAGEARPRLALRPRRLEGDPGRVLVERSSDALLLVVGARGHHELVFRLGSVSGTCVRHARSPVVVVPRPEQDDSGRPVAREGRILAGVDGSDGSRGALAWAFEEAALRECPLEVVSCWHDPYTNDMSLEYEAPYFRRDRVTARRSAERQLARLVAALEPGSGVKVSQLLLEGDAAYMLCDEARGADLLVVGSQGRGGFARLLLGSVSSTCAHESPCPTAVIHRRRKT